MSESGSRGPRPLKQDRSGSGEDQNARPPSHAVEGTVYEALPNAMYSVELVDGRKVLAHVPSSVQTRMVRVLPGDRVTVELSPYDPLRGRITRRHR